MVKNEASFDDFVKFKTIFFIINGTAYPISITKDKDNYYIASNINILGEDFKYMFGVKNYIIKNYNNITNSSIVNI